jgi:hypothetical protein
MRKRKKTIEPRTVNEPLHQRIEPKDTIELENGDQLRVFKDGAHRVVRLYFRAAPGVFSWTNTSLRLTTGDIAKIGELAR